MTPRTVNSSFLAKHLAGVNELVRAFTRPLHEKCKDETGDLTLVLATIILVSVALIVMLFNIIRFGSEIIALDGLAEVAAQEGGSGLPDPVLAKQKANRAIKAVDPTDKLTVQFFFSSGKGFRIPCIASTLPFAATPVCNDADISGRVEFPLESITIRISKVLPLLQAPYLIFSTSWTIHAERTFSVAPSDVTLIVENSNSLITPLNPALPSPHHAFSTDNNIKWDQMFSPMWGGNISKAEWFTRACFGEAAINLKRAAVAAYDYLSASSQIRLAVINPLSANLEQAPVLVPFGANPFIRARSILPTTSQASQVNQEYSHYGIDYNPNAAPNHSYFLNQNALDQTYMPTEEMGVGGHARTRCAALTDAFPVPGHFLKSRFSASNYYNLIERFDQVPASLGSANWLGNLSQISTQDPLWNLTFRPRNLSGLGKFADEPLAAPQSGRLLPREAIWIKNSGYQTAAGNPIPEFDYISWSLSIAQAMSLLYTAPPRLDKQPVRKRNILVFSDGLDQHQRPFGSSSVLGYPQVHLVSNTATPNMYDLSYDLGQSDIACLWHSRGNGLADPRFDIVNVTDAQAGNATKMLSGMKLGFLLYGFGGISQLQGGPQSFQASLNNHYLPDMPGRLSNFENSCNQPVHERRGRFFSYINSSQVNLPLNAASLNSPQDYQTLAKIIARTLVTPIILR